MCVGGMNGTTAVGAFQASLGRSRVTRVAVGGSSSAPSARICIEVALEASHWGWKKAFYW